MNKALASQLINTLAEAIRKDPAQFHFNLNISGMNVRASGGSTGVIVSATGGAPGSSTIGMNISLDNHDIEIAKQTANAVLNQQMNQLYSTLKEIASGLEKDDTGKIEDLYQSLKNNWVPGVITSIVGNILTVVLGIAS